jgi:hypothetical protein
LAPSITPAVTNVKTKGLRRARRRLGGDVRFVPPAVEVGCVSPSAAPERRNQLSYYRREQLLRRADPVVEGGGHQWRLQPSTRQIGEHGFNSWAAFAAGPSGEVVAAVALTEAESLRQLARRLRGELDVSDGWSPPLTGVE